ncbi:MAG TPA: hypothetical protein VHJ83_01525, partial [Micromonosporaceae bacterium]|nr:hypothetical protein [Micromonosporaceae bacterium]
MNSLTSRWSRMPRGLRSLQRVAAVSLASGVAVLAFAGPALAVNATIPINDAHVPTTAADFPENDCSDETQLPQKPGQDGWHFVLPKGSPIPAVFVQVRLTFTDTGGATQTKTIPGDGTLGPPSAKHAILYTPAGWTLTAGEADITGQSEDGKPAFFNLSHVCVAGPSESPTPSPTGTVTPSESPTVAPSETPSQSPTVAPSETPSQAPSGSVAPSSSPTSPGGQLPVTGLAIGGIVLTGLGLVGAGAAMRALRRRNPAAADTPEAEGDSDGEADDK